MMYIWMKFIAFITAFLASISSNIANMKVEDPVIEEEQEIVFEQVEPQGTEEVEIKVERPTYYANHVYINDIDVEIVEVDPTNSYQLQTIVDDPYKGVSYKYYKCTYVGDHSHEGFATLPYVKVNDIMYWNGKTYKCYYADDSAYLDSMRNIVLSNGQYLYDQNCIALVTCRTDYTRYVRLFKEA